MLTVIGSPQTRTLRVLWALEELGLDYEHQPHPPHAKEVFDLTGAGKVPALVDGDLVVTDSTAILHYLSDKHGALTHAAGSPERALQDSLTFQILDEIEGPLWMLAKHKFVHPKERRVPEAAESFRWEVSRGLDRLDQTLKQGPFLMGEVFTIADIIATHALRWAGNAGVSDQPENLAAYVNRTTARPAAQTVLAS